MHFGSFVLILPRVEGNLVAPHQHLVGLIPSSLLPPARGHHPPQSYCWKTLAKHPKLAEKQSGYPDGIISAGVSCSDNAGTTHHPPKRCSQQLFSPHC